MNARMQGLTFDPAKLNCPSPGLIASHHQNNHGGAVKRLNAIRAQLATTAFWRYQNAVSAASQTLGASHDAIGDARVLDVRRAGVFEQAPKMIPGARRCAPAAVATWSGELPAGREPVVYGVCVHEVGRAAAIRLRAAPRANTAVRRVVQ